MTKLMVELVTQEDIAIASLAHADVIVMDVAKCGGDGLQSLSNNKLESMEVWACYCKPTNIDSDEMKRSGADAIAIKIASEDPIAEIRSYRIDYATLPVVLFIKLNGVPDLTWLPLVAAMGVQGIVFQNESNGIHILSQLEVADIGRLIKTTHQSRLKVGVAEGLEVPDIPRLLPFNPDWLGFSVTKPVVEGHFGEEKTTALIRALLPFDLSPAVSQTGEGSLGTDRIIVKDFILPIEIGAYKHEYGHKQRVCFNVVAEVERLSSNPEDMSHIFSYDLILDGIRNLVSLGHIELVETLAERIAALILAYPRVHSVMVRVEKLDLGPAAVGVEIKRYKDAHNTLN